MNTDMTVEELLAEREVLKKTIQVQKATIDRLVNAYVLKIQNQPDMIEK